MKKTLTSILALGLMTSSTFAQVVWKDQTKKEHLAFQIKAGTLQKFIISSLNTYKDSETGKLTFDIPAKKFNGSEKLTEEKFQTAVDTIYELTGLDLSQSFDYNINSTKGTAKAFVVNEDFKINLSQASANTFIIDLSGAIKDIDLYVGQISICEGKVCKKDSLKADIKGASIKQVANTKLIVKGKLKVTINNQVASLEVTDFSTNLGKSGGPQINVNFKDIIVPPVSISINGQVTSMDTSKIKEMVLSYKKDIAKKIVNTVAKIMKDKVASAANDYLKSKSISTQFNYNYTKPMKIDLPEYEEENEDRYELDYRIKPMERDNTYVAPPVMPQPKVDLSKLLMNKFLSMIDSIGFGINLSKTQITNNNLFVSIAPTLTLNGEKQTIGNSIGHGNYARQLGNISFKGAPEKFDMALGISEAYINSILTLAHKQKIFNGLKSVIDDMTGIRVASEGIKIHVANYSGTPRLFLVVNMVVFLNEIKTESWKDWFLVKAAYLFDQLNSTDGTYIFPMEFEIQPQIVTENNKKFIKLKVLSPVDIGDHLKNNFGYYSNLKNTYGKIRTELASKIKEMTSSYTGSDLKFPLDQYMTTSDVTIKPLKVDVENSGHIVIYSDIKDFKLKAGL